MTGETRKWALEHKHLHFFSTLKGHYEVITLQGIISWFGHLEMNLIAFCHLFLPFVQSSHSRQKAKFRVNIHRNLETQNACSVW